MAQAKARLVSVAQEGRRERDMTDILNAFALGEIIGVFLLMIVTGIMILMWWRG